MQNNGLVPKTQVLTQRAELNRLTRELLELRRSRDLADNALATLIGVPAGDFKVPDGHLQKRVQIAGGAAGAAFATARAPARSDRGGVSRARSLRPRRPGEARATADHQPDGTRRQRKSRADRLAEELHVRLSAEHQHPDPRPERARARQDDRSANDGRRTAIPRDRDGRIRRSGERAGQSRFAQEAARRVAAGGRASVRSSRRRSTRN